MLPKVHLNLVVEDGVKRSVLVEVDRGVLNPGVVNDGGVREKHFLPPPGVGRGVSPVGRGHQVGYDPGAPPRPSNPDRGAVLQDEEMTTARVSVLAVWVLVLQDDHRPS